MKNIKTEAKSIYICHTYFHLLITIIKRIQSKEKTDLIITACSGEKTLIKDSRIRRKLEKYHLFENITLVDDDKGNAKYNKFSFTRFAHLKYCSIKYRQILNRYNRVFIYSDETLIGKTLTMSGIKYYLLEDGINSMGNPQYVPKRTLKKRMLEKIGIYQLAQSPNIINYEVNDALIVPDFIDKEKIIEVPKRMLFESLCEKDRQKLLYIFGAKKEIIEANYDILILTQPFDIGYPFISEKEKISIYQKIINKYEGKKILIKTHPREKTNYEKYFPNCDVITEKFPVELLNFLPVKFDEVVTVSSTAAIYNTGKTTVMGWKWLDKETNGAIYGKK